LPPCSSSRNDNVTQTLSSPSLNEVASRMPIGIRAALLDRSPRAAVRAWRPLPQCRSQHRAAFVIPCRHAHRHVRGRHADS
jgi:hypothetical protein